MSPDSTEGKRLSPGYETRDARPARVLLWFGGMVVMIACVLYSVKGELSSFASRHGLPAVTLAPTTSPLYDESAPRLQVDPAEDLARFKEQEERVLTSYGWSNRAAQEARIPIDQAMKLLLRRGISTTSRRGSGRNVR